MFVSILDKTPQTPEKLGGKGFGLWQMQQSGVNVPPALVIPTSVCVDYMAKPKSVMKEIAKQMPEIEKFFVAQMGYMPLLSIRSGARVSMPGMMDTILNVGLDSTSLEYWTKKLGGKCADDSYSRLVEMYGSVVEDIARDEFEDRDLEDRMSLFEILAEKPFPNAHDQILGSIEAVFKSWENERAKVYRNLHGIPHEWGTAVVIQAMVFGNFNDQSATGVLFTRNPDTGLAKVTGEFLINAQGEDVVAGIKTPLPLEDMNDWNPTVHQELLHLVLKLEQERRDVQDVEFTIQDGKLYVLQTRNAKRSAQAAIRIALDMMSEGVLTKQQAISRISRAQYAMMQQPIIDPKFKEETLASGIPACSGVATGIVVLSAEDAINCKEPCILVTKETTPDDIAGMVAAKGVVTMQGGSTSHAAVVARGMNKPCIVGVGLDLSVFVAGQKISLDGATGRIWTGEVPVIDNSNSEELQLLNVLMQESMGCKLISDDPSTGCAVLDVTNCLLQPEELAKRIMTRLSKPGDFIVDLALTPGSEQMEYLNLFVDPQVLEWAAVECLAKMPADKKARFKVLTTAVNVKGVEMIATVSSLEDLINANGSFVLQDVPKSPALAKVLGWKKAEGAEPMAFGVVTETDSYLSHEQVVSALLVS